MGPGTSRAGAALPLVEWWIGWSTPPAVADELLERGLVPDDDEPVLTGMTCSTEPPGGAARRGAAARDRAAVPRRRSTVDWTVWNIPDAERERRLATEVDRFEAGRAAGTVHHWAAYDDEAPVGFGRAIDMAEGVALMGGAVLPSARGRGVYRALVHARWEHAAARGTPLLVVQAGHMSAPILDGLGFERHGEIRLYADRL